MNAGDDRRTLQEEWDADLARAVRVIAADIARHLRGGR